MPPSSSIPGFLARVRALVYRHEARLAAFYALAVLGGLALLLPIIGVVIVGSRATALAILGTAGLVAMLVVLGAVVVGFVVPRKRWGRDRELARWVGTRHKSVASDLLSAVELAEAPKRVGAPSNELVSALIESTASELKTIEPASLIAPDEIKRARALALGAIAANIALLVIVPGFIGRGWRQLMSAPPSPFDGAQLSSIPLVGDLNATLTFPAYSKRKPLELPSSSGDFRGLPGTVVKIDARMLVPTSHVELVIEGGAEPKKIAAKLDGDRLTAQLTIEESARYRIAVRMPNGERKIEATPRAIDAEPDQAPAVQLMAPADTLDVANLRRIELAYVVEDDYGVTSAELVWEGGKDRGRKPITLGDLSQSRAQGKLMWDIAELQVPSGGDVRYWIEAKDNDTVGGPNIGRSRELHLRVVSPRERHEETLDRQQAVAEKLLKNLGARLVGFGDNITARDDQSHQLREAIVELSAIESAYEADPHTSEIMRKAIGGIHDRLDRMQASEQKLMPKGSQKLSVGRFAALDVKLTAELEDDLITLADWLDRERLEGLLDVSDEIAAHQKRLSDLLAQYNKTKDPRLLEEIEREMKALERGYAELDKHKKGMAEDVLDQYVNRDALASETGTSCMADVRSLVVAGKTTEAQARLEQCQQQHQKGAGSLEGSLAQLRGDKFGDEQKKLDEVMNELADLAKDQDDIAAEADRIFEQYARKADDTARDHRREASKKVGTLVDKLRKRLSSINESGLTPFAKEELDIVDRRINDVEKMVADGDLAEGLGMARQAKQSLDTIAGELEAAISDDPKGKWADATADALDGIEYAAPVAKELIDELSALSPKPEQIMSADDLKAMDRLRRREALNKQRTQKLGERTKQMGQDLPGDASQELSKKLGQAAEHMTKADERLKGKDPSGARESTRSAADALAKARDRAKSAARQAQEGAIGDEPIRIPGADEYKAPERFRENLLDAAKHKPVGGFEDMTKRYYDELVK